MGGARGPGGIQGLLELAESYPDEFVFELHKLGYTPRDIGRRIDHVDADRLLRVSSREPSSWLFAVMNGWAYPVSREWLLAADHLDFFVASKSKRKPKPYPRPWKDKNTSRLGQTTLTPAQAREVLRRNRG